MSETARFFLGLLLVVFATAVAVNVYGQPMTVQRYLEICPRVDFSPRPDICYRFRIRRVCPPTGTDFSPRPPVDICIDGVEVLCPIGPDFSPLPPECQDEDERSNE